MVIKCYDYTQRNSPGTDGENILSGNLCIMKVNVRHQEKGISSIKEYLPIQIMISSSSENSEHPTWSHFNI